MSLSADFNLNTIKDTYDHSCFLARLDEYRHVLTDPPGAKQAAPAVLRLVHYRPRRQRDDVAAAYGRGR
jgi:hypothetical protein